MSWYLQFKQLRTAGPVFGLGGGELSNLLDRAEWMNEVARWNFWDTLFPGFHVFIWF